MELRSHGRRTKVNVVKRLEPQEYSVVINSEFELYV